MRYPDMPDRYTRIVFDLDNTLAVDIWPSPEIGEPIKQGIDALIHYYNLGYEIVIYTSRPESHKERIWRWLDEYGLRGVVYDVKTDKPPAGLYIDDKSWRPSWVENL